MICEHEPCGAFFCDDNMTDAGALSPSQRKYCDQTCAKHASNARARARKRGEPVPVPVPRVPVPAGMPCPTGNVRYPAKHAAGSAGRAWVQSLQGAGLHLTHDLRCYECPECRDWHYDKSTAFVTPPMRPLAASRFGHKKKPRTAAAPTIIDGNVGPCPVCGKKRYPTKRDALDLRKQRPDAGFRAYKCGNFWHLTTRDAVTIERYRSQGARAQGKAS